MGLFSRRSAPKAASASAAVPTTPTVGDLEEKSTKKATRFGTQDVVAEEGAPEANGNGAEGAPESVAAARRVSFTGVAGGATGILFQLQTALSGCLASLQALPCVPAQGPSNSLPDWVLCQLEDKMSYHHHLLHPRLPRPTVPRVTAGIGLTPAGGSCA